MIAETYTIKKKMFTLVRYDLDLDKNWQKKKIEIYIVFSGDFFAP